MNFIRSCIFIFISYIFLMLLLFKSLICNCNTSFLQLVEVQGCRTVPLFLAWVQDGLLYGWYLCRLFQLNELFLTEPQKARIYHYYVPVFLWCEQQITEHQSKFKDGEDIPPLVVCYILVTLSAIVLFIFILIWKN